MEIDPVKRRTMEEWERALVEEGTPPTEAGLPEQSCEAQ